MLLHCLSPHWPGRMSLLSRYKTWVRANSSSISAVEGGLSGLTWLLPDRFSESELALEAFNSLLGFLSLYHESILSSPAAGQALPQLPWTFWLAALQQVRSPECSMSLLRKVWSSHR